VQLSDYRRLLARIYGERAWIVAIDVLAGATPFVRDPRALGATRCLCIAASEGAGPRPDPEFAPDPIVLGVRADDLMSGIRRSLDALARLAPEAVRRIDAFDPRREARAIGTLFDDGRPLAGRAKYGALGRMGYRVLGLDAELVLADLPRAIELVQNALARW
jgi:hypothetical protein